MQEGWKLQSIILAMSQWTKSFHIGNKNKETPLNIETSFLIWL